ncbi:MAG: hypothetical protein ABR936_14885 [Bacteroidota bacterium]
MENIIIKEGIINFIFPFSFENTWLPLFSEKHHLKDSSAYLRYINKVKELVNRNKVQIQWGTTWIPDDKWAFSPRSFDNNSPPLKVENPNDVDHKLNDNKDRDAILSFDEFYYLKDSFKRQPLLRMRLKERLSAHWNDVNTDCALNAYVDLSLFLKMGLGSVIIRLPINNISVDDLIQLRLSQFRKNINIHWTKENTNITFDEIQDLYLDYCKKIFRVELEPIHDVKMYSASIEIFSFTNRSTRDLTFHKVVSDYFRQLYGILCCDESWRKINTEQAKKTLKEQSFSTRKNRIQYAQEVTFMIYNGITGVLQIHNDKTSSAVERYNKIIASTDRNIADGYYYLEFVCIQHIFLYLLYADTRTLMEVKKFPRRKLIQLRQKMITGRLFVIESFNVFTGLPPTLERMHGLDHMRNGVKESIEAIEKIMDNYRFFNQELISDIFTTLAISIGIASLLVSTHVSQITTVKMALGSFITFFTFTRMHKYPKDVRSILLFILMPILITILLLTK